MPSAIPRRDIMAATSWRRPKVPQQRQASTAQEAIGNDGDQSASAILHGSKGARTDSRLPSNHDRSSKQTPQARPSTSQSQHSHQKGARHIMVNDALRTKDQNSPRHTGKRQREPERHGGSRLSKTPRVEPDANGKLKDSAYVRRTMHVPTSKDYPNAKSAVFQNPKNQLSNALHGSLQPEYTRFGKSEFFRCTLSCTYFKSDPAEVTIGEGTIKVISPPNSDSRLLTNCRKLQKMQLIWLCSHGSMNKVVSARLSTRRSST